MFVRVFIYFNLALIIKDIFQVFLKKKKNFYKFNYLHRSGQIKDTSNGIIDKNDKKIIKQKKTQKSMTKS